ncbi:hypothetical protein [Streptomyces sp. NPDC047706]|uniref:hypothetical protein n=1 Tax=Streptomyces sp. NPDC047706 TaxID=3365486 RepID=UPI00372489C6
MSIGQDDHGPEIELLRAVLLDRQVSLPEPPDRMAGIRKRFHRTRRLKAAAATAAAMPLAVALAVVLSPQLVTDRTADVAGRTTRPPASPPTDPASSSLPDVADLDLPVPPDWNQLTIAAGSDQASSVRFISTNPLARPERSCPDLEADDWAESACLPVSGPGIGALMAFQIETDPAAARATTDSTPRFVEASPACRSLSGTKMYKLQRPVGAEHPDAVLTGVACVGELTEEANRRVMLILSKALPPES